jgi:hypothetical protein
VREVNQGIVQVETQMLSPFVELWFTPPKTRTDCWGRVEVPWWRIVWIRHG